MLTRFALTESTESVSRKCNLININVSGDTMLILTTNYEEEPRNYSNVKLTAYEVRKRKVQRG